MTHSVSMLTFKALIKSISLIKTSTKNHILSPYVLLVLHSFASGHITLFISPLINIYSVLLYQMQSYMATWCYHIGGESKFFLACLLSYDKPFTCVVYCRYNSLCQMAKRVSLAHWWQYLPQHHTWRGGSQKFHRRNFSLKNRITVCWYWRGHVFAVGSTWVQIPPTGCSYVSSL